MIATHTNTNQLAIEVRNLKKSFPVGTSEEHALVDTSASIKKGGFAIIFGPSGSGKSTLLNMIIGLELPTSGEVFVEGVAMHRLDDDARARIRMESFGVVYQQPLWVKSLTVIENVALPAILDGVTKEVATERAHRLLEGVGMSEYHHYRPAELSGGQQQRTSLARALILDPPILILDEPTGNLDTQNADHMIDILQSLNRQRNVTIVMVTHNLSYLKYADHTIEIVDGTVKNQNKS